MSLLDAIKNKKSTLKHASTVITRADGRRFVENSAQESLQEIKSAGFGFVVDTKPDNVPAQVLDHLYLGSQDCCELEVLQKYQISCILSVGIEPPCKCPEVIYKFVPCLDLPETDIAEILIRDCAPFITDCIQDKKLNLLVHCNAGVSRSSAIIIGYLIYVKHFSYDFAYNIVKTARNCIKPNNGFELQLKHFSRP